MRSLGPRETRDLLERYGLKPRTSIGQHFITDPNSVRKIVDIAGVAPGDQVLEVGPGLGALSIALVDAGASLIAIERDRSLRRVLDEVLAGGDVRILWQDALRVDYAELLRGVPTLHVANLPYQIATPLIVSLLERHPEVTSHTVMVQREVGERLVARPGTDAYGAVSAKIAYLGEARVAMRVSRRVFYPMPEVESVVVRIDRRVRAPVAGERQRIFRVIEGGFAQRRKTMRAALRAAGWNVGDVEAALARAGVAPSARAETLGLEEFAALAEALP